MGKKFGFIVIMCLCILSCNEKYTMPYKDIDRIIHTYKNVDGTRNFHLVDSIPFDSSKFVVVSTKEYTKYFFVSKDYLKEHKQIRDKEVFDSNFGVFQVDFASWTDRKYFGYYHKDEAYHSGAYTFCPLGGNYQGWDKVYFNIPPAFFRVYLARGEEYNVLYGMTTIDGPSHRPYFFPDRKGYYKIYVPVWK